MECDINKTEKTNLFCDESLKLLLAIMRKSLLVYKRIVSRTGGWRGLLLFFCLTISSLGLYPQRSEENHDTSGMIKYEGLAT